MTTKERLIKIEGKLDENLKSQDRLWKLMNGEAGVRGVLSKVDLMWAGHIPVTALLSGVPCLIIGYLLNHFFGK